MKRMQRSRFSSLRYALAYIAQSRSYILFATLLFFLATLVSLSSPALFSSFDALLRDLARQSEGLNGVQLFFFIFQNNLMSAFFALFLGVFFGIVPLFNALLNGAVLGYVLSRVLPIAGVDVLWRLLPHGIFELPAIFIAIGLGIKLGFSFFVKPVKRTLLKRLDASCKVFLFVIFPLLFIAAVIESLLIIFF